MSSHANTARDEEITPQTGAPRLQKVCPHCGGSGREPAPLAIEFSRSGDLRGEQQRVADACGISTSMLSYIIAGERTPGVLTLIKLAHYYRTTVDRVLRVPAIWRQVHRPAPRA